MSGGFHFRKSWGAEPVEGGSLFRIWAPSQRRMSVRAAATGRDLPMHGEDDGWFSLRTDLVGAGEGYSFVLDDGTVVNDPAARAQIDGVNGPSRLVDPGEYRWRAANWRGRPLEEVVIYELHTGTFSPEGSFDGVRRRLDHLAETGVTAIELMPVAQFGGNRGWGYDGVLLYAPHVAYGGPEALKRLVDEAHGRELMMILDVVYNHFGPEGNYLPLYAPDFFHPEHRTPWGGAIAYEKEPVRAFFIENALFWLEEYRFDGLRLDAIDQIERQSEEPLLTEIAEAVRGRFPDRHIHLTTEDERNIVRLHERNADGTVRLYSAEWNDDVHHAAHVIAAGEHDGYYIDNADDPVGQLARALAEGFIYQGERSTYRGDSRGVRSAHLPPTAFVDFVQNHDQIGNRAFGERLTSLARPEVVETLTAILLLSPHLPLLFMGEEWGETRPFLFFADFHGELGDAVREGRRREFAHWPLFAAEESRTRIADPNAETTFGVSVLDWRKLEEPLHRARFQFIKRLLAARRRDIVPLLAEIGGDAGSFAMLGKRAFAERWRLSGGGTLSLHVNLGDAAVALDGAPPGRILHAHGVGAEDALAGASLAAGAVISTVEGRNDFTPLPI